ncbi:MAG: alpha/beta fold hydrolase [Promethearchaeota archaeon]|nr:MAG: alpha/beta fold hydrolase [Candidatus Lokiarchaeota archaeon]
MGKIRKELSKRSILLILPILLLGIVLSFLIVDRAQGYVYYERLEFKCGDVELHANLYHPTKKLDFQDKHPLVIYIHGFSSQKDTDFRIPLELTKRGFFVASVDMPGHGESANSDLLDIEDDEFVSTQMCSELLDKIEKLKIYSRIDEDQIGLIGHSYGGYVALMNGLYDDRFKVTVSWAGVADIMKPYKGVDISDRKKDLLHENNPVEVMNNASKQPDNLLLIVHKEDYWYKYNKRLQDLTDCEWEVYTYPVSGVQEAHYLLHRTVMIKTINWFEKEFFETTSKNGPIELSYQYTFLLLILAILFGILSMFSIIIYSSKFIIKKRDSKSIKTTYQNKMSSISDTTSASSKKKQIMSLSLSILIFISLILLGSFLLGVWAVLFTSFIIILLYYLLIRRKLRKKEPDLSDKLSLKDRIKSKDTKLSLVYSVSCSLILLGFYFAFSLAYPFWFYYPHSFLAILIAMIYIPIYLALEIFYRKILFPSLKFVKSSKNQTYIISGITVFVQIILLFHTLLYWSLPVLIVTSVAFMIVSIINGIIYQKTKRLEATVLNSFIIMSLFYGAAWSFILNLILIIS